MGSDLVSSWIGVLSRGGVLTTEREERGVMSAMTIVGEERLGELREWFAGQPRAVVDRERRAAVEVCIWMAAADRVLAEEERELLERIILESELPDAASDELRAMIGQEPELRDIDARLTQPTLRELLLTLAWQMARADGSVEDAEASAHERLRELFGVPESAAVRARTLLGKAEDPAV